MINTDEILSYLGLTHNSSELKQYLFNLSINLENDLKLPQGDYRAYIELKDKGLCLVFTDEAYFFGRSADFIGVGSLVFSGVFFYSEGKDKYKQFNNALPSGLLFNDNHGQLISKLGEPSWQRLSENQVRAARWDGIEGAHYRIHVTYKKSSGEVSVISCSIPDQVVA